MCRSFWRDSFVVQNGSVNIERNYDFLHTSTKISYLIAALTSRTMVSYTQARLSPIKSFDLDHQLCGANTIREVEATDDDTGPLNAPPKK